jgi:hypothetical protein
MDINMNFIQKILLLSLINIEHTRLHIIANTRKLPEHATSLPAPSQALYRRSKPVCGIPHSNPIQDSLCS